MTGSFYQAGSPRFIKRASPYGEGVGLESSVRARHYGPGLIIWASRARRARVGNGMLIGDRQMAHSAGVVRASSVLRVVFSLREEAPDIFGDERSKWSGRLVWRV